MNYLRMYVTLMRKCKNRQPPQYGEKHHIFPKSIFGKNNNTVVLTYLEHVECHRLLWLGCKQRYGDNHAYTIKMAKAYYSTTRNKTVSDEQAAEARRAHAESMKGKNNPMFGKPGTFLGKKHSCESIQLLKQSKKKNYDAILKAASLGGIAVQAKRTPEERKRIAQKMGAATKGISKALGYKWYNNGQTEKKLSACPIGDEWKPGRIPHSEESNKLRSRTLKNRIFEKVQCPNCQKIGAKPVMSRFHFENCKIIS